MTNVKLLIFLVVSFLLISVTTSRQPYRWNRQRSVTRRRNGGRHLRSQGRAHGRRGRPNNRRQRKPNIIFIMADDLGWNDVGFHNELINTPNIDWLARNGIELTDYHTEPMCTPSRAALLTGRYPSRIGMQQAVLRARSKQCLPTSLKLLPEMMKENGYTTKMVGKWHLGYCNVTCLPTRRGFDEYRGVLEGLSDYLTWKSFGMVTRYVNEQPDTANIGTHLTIQHQRDVEEMIMSHRNADSPLFMYIAPLAPHDPLLVTDEMFNSHPFLNASDQPQLERRRYLGLVSALDDLVGTTISALRRANLYENSVIVFTSDNGGQAARIRLPSIFSFGNNYPLRGGKGELFEGGHRVPTIYHTPRLPRRVRGTKRNFLIHITDWLPTFVQMANQSCRLGEVDGVSQVSNLHPTIYREDPYRVRDGHLVYLTNFSAPDSKCSNADAAIRWRNWKLIYGKASGTLRLLANETGVWTRPIESPNTPTISGDSCSKTDENGEPFVGCLFNLQNDPSEQRDLYYQHPDIVSRLRREIEQAKQRSVANVYRPPQPISSVTTTTINGVVVSTTGYCNPELDSLIRPVDPTCPL